MTTILSRAGLCVLLLFMSGDAAPTPRRAAQKTLTALQDFIGPWRGVGQIRRGSSQGAWTEQAEWVWKFEDQTASVRFTAPKSKYLRSGVISPSGRTGRLQLEAAFADSTRAIYKGSVVVQRKGDEGRLVFEAVKKTKAAPARITLRLTAGGKRLVMLLERRLGAGRYTRLAEIGYTRRGSQFGKGATYIECVVTGGLGTIPVSYNGRTYQVCCSGCRDLFNADPKAVLDDYHARKMAEKKKRKKE